MSTRYRYPLLSHFQKEVPKFLYLGATLRNLGYSLLGIFGTIYLYQLFRDYGFNEREAFTLTLLRVAIFYLLKLALNFPVAKLVTKVGAKTTIMIGSSLSAISMITWAMAQNSLWWLIPGLLIGAMQANIYWIPYHSIFSSKSQEQSIGKQMGVLSIIGAVIGIVTPIVSSLIIEDFGGFNVLFAVSFMVLTLSSVAFSFMTVNLQIDDFNLLDFPKALKKEKRLFPDYLVIGMESVVQNVVWAIFVFLFIGSFLKLGILSSGISLALAVCTYFIGKLSDEKKVGGIDRFGAMFNSIVWIGKLFVQTGLHVFFLDSLFGLFRTSYAVPIDVIVYANAKHDNPMWPVLIREIALDMGRFGTALGAALLIYFGFDYWSIFLLAAFGYLALGFLLKDNEIAEGN